MRILYDHQIFDLQRFGGISRYFAELFKCMDRLQSCDASIAIKHSMNEYLKNSKYFKKNEDSKYLKFIRFIVKEKIYNLWRRHRLKGINRNLSIQRLKQQDFDVFHPTYYSRYCLDFLENKPFVLTVYDMIHELFPNQFEKNDKTAINKKFLVEKAAKVIAISESTKQDLLKIYSNLSADKVEVVHLATDMMIKDVSDVDVPFEGRYILFVGRREGYKNFNLFVKSIAPLLLQDKELFLICVGGGSFATDELEYLRKLGILNQVKQFTVNDEQLMVFYKNALVFVFPSLYEGFGIPVLEAFACECPVAVSNTSSLPEVGGEAVQLFDPYDINSIQDSLERVVMDKNLRQMLIKLGKLRLQNFSWKKTAEKTYAIYQDCM